MRYLLQWSCSRRTSSSPSSFQCDPTRPFSEAEGRPIGIVTEWDILAKVVAAGRDPATVRLEELMTRPLVFVDAGEGIDRVAEIMAEKGIRRVLVEKDGRVLGVIRNQTIVRRMRDYIDSISAQIARAQLPPL